MHQTRTPSLLLEGRGEGKTLPRRHSCPGPEVCPPLQSATGSAASPSAIRDPAKQYVRSKSRAAQHRGKEERRRGPGGAEATALAPKNLGTSALADRNRPGCPSPAPRRRERKMPRDLPGRPAPPPRRPRRPAAPPAPRPPPLAAASPSPPGLARTLLAPRAARKGACDMRAAPSCPRGPDAAAATAAAPRGINPGLPSPISASPVASASASSSGGCAAPSHPHSRRPWTGKTAGISLTRFWLWLRGTNLPSPGPPPFGDTHNSARSSPGFSAGEEEEAEEAAARPSPERPRPPRPRAPLARPLAITAVLQDPPLGGMAQATPPALPFHSRLRRPSTPGRVPSPPGQKPEIHCPPHQLRFDPLGPGALRYLDSLGNSRGAACPRPSPGAQAAAAALNASARGEPRPRCPNALSIQRWSGAEWAFGAAGPSTLAAPPGGDDVLHFVGTAVGTWDPFKTKPRGAGKLVPGKPRLGSAIRPREQPRLLASASAGP
ncbi:hypothetical protein P7K49_012258 [Saguinus oedipus]|uniref:Basic proline-rich protein-like n=1 Tax=Saguinus oedipus TaxID=9490 RepID=A0ABQ9VSX7_SAGOE|nr:hypothetical protein P7K49_012258 [Saguinus oedipus]